MLEFASTKLQRKFYNRMPKLPLRSTLAQEKLCLTAELSLNGIETYIDLKDQIASISGVVDGVHVPYNIRFSPHALCRILLDHGIEPILQISSANRSLTDMEIELRGAISSGVSNFILLKGEVKQGQDIEEFGAVPMLQHVNQMRPELGNNFFLGTTSRVFKPAVSWRPNTLFSKVEAGATFIKTQPCFNPDQIKTYATALSRWGILERAPLIVTTTVLPSLNAANYLKEKERIRIPETVFQRLEKATDLSKESANICFEFVQDIEEISGIGGISVQAPGNPTALKELALLFKQR